MKSGGRDRIELLLIGVAAILAVAQFVIVVSMIF